MTTNSKERPAISEVIVVEGRDDEAAIQRAVDAATIPTHGYGISSKTLELIANAYQRQGIIIFTDPDFAGEQIRKRLTSLFPLAKQAFLTRKLAEKAGDIGIENAQPQAIMDALSAAKAESRTSQALFTADDMFTLGLSGHSTSSALREAVGAELGIGSGNAKAFMNRLNRLGIQREELLAAWKNCTEEAQSGA